MHPLITGIIIMLVLGFLGWLPAALYLIGGAFLFASIFAAMTCPIWLMYYLHKWTSRK